MAGWSRRTVLTLAAAGGFSLIAAGAVWARDPEKDPFAVVGPLPDEVVSHEGIRWRLTTVTDASGTTPVPSAVDAWFELNGARLFAYDGINVINASVTSAGDGFILSDILVSAAGYAGKDPVQLAVINGFDTLTANAQSQPMHLTVVSANQRTLAVESGGVRLGFDHGGPANHLVG